MKFKKILVIGISGTGKSTFSRQIAAITGLPLHHMDSIIWRENWREASPAEIEQGLAKIEASTEWIVEGWIDHYSKGLLVQADVVYYLDFPGWLAALGGLQRWWKYRGSKRPELPERCPETFTAKYLQIMLRQSERPHIETLLAELKPMSIIRFVSRAEVRQQLVELERSSLGDNPSKQRSRPVE